MRFTPAACAVALLARSSAALADTNRECGEAYDHTQVLRDAGNIEAALAEAEVCTREVCAKFIRDDCNTWKTALEERQSSVVIEVLDPTGGAVTEGTVSLDTVPWLDRLGGGAHVLSKGSHILEITVKGVAPLKKSVVILEGEKSRKLSFTVAPSDTEDGLVLVDPDAPRPGSGQDGTRLLVPGIVTAAAGLAFAVTGGVLLGLAASKASTIRELCGDAPPACSGSAADAREASDLGRSGKQLEIAGATLSAIGGVGVVVGATLMVLDASRGSKSSDDKPRAGALLPGGWLGRGEGGLWLHGTF